MSRRDHPLYPLELDSQGEPFLCLEKNTNITLSTFRHYDGPALVEMLNDERVLAGLDELPSPYTEGEDYPGLPCRKSEILNKAR
jgi:hypothetical protein